MANVDERVTEPAYVYRLTIRRSQIETMEMGGAEGGRAAMLDHFREQLFAHIPRRLVGWIGVEGLALHRSEIFEENAAEAQRDPLAVAEITVTATLHDDDPQFDTAGVVAHEAVELIIALWENTINSTWGATSLEDALDAVESDLGIFADEDLA